MKGNIIIGALVLGVCLGLCGCRAPVGTTDRHAESGPALWHRGDGLHFGTLDAVFRRMVQALPGTFRPAAFTFSLEIVEDPLPNAFTCGGGKVFVTSGMVRLLEIDGTLQRRWRPCSWRMS
ncbi:MAG TPA: hypothetical protein DCS43_01655 [Verrucomicrobia bacterium]|nr:hypothetical protein [Verrucomicrobiota bacterium]